MIEADTIRLLHECDAEVKMGISSIDDLMIDGCDMGVKSLNKYLNQYEAADEVSKDITKRLIHLEENLRDGIKEFL